MAGLNIQDAAQAGIMVTEAASLTAQTQHLLSHLDLRRDMGPRAFEALTAHQGAARRQPG